MQSYWMQMSDEAAVLEMRDTAVPQPGANQLLVRMRAASLNRGEFVSGHGLHGQAVARDELAAVERGGRDAHQDLLRAGRRHGRVAHLQRCGVVGHLHPVGLHGVFRFGEEERAVSGR